MLLAWQRVVEKGRRRRSLKRKPRTKKRKTAKRQADCVRQLHDEKRTHHSRFRARDRWNDRVREQQSRHGRELIDGPAAAPATDQKAENPATPITVTGCLQHDGGTYIVTRLNEPSQKGVGTSGSAAAVEHEQLREAANAYRVDPKQDTDLDKMVGKQVSVSGTVEDKANLPQASGTSGQSAPDDRADIGRSDLAKISAQTVSVVADNCGGATDCKGHVKGGSRQEASLAALTLVRRTRASRCGPSPSRLP